MNVLPSVSNLGRPNGQGWEPERSTIQKGILPARLRLLVERTKEEVRIPTIIYWLVYLHFTMQELLDSPPIYVISSTRRVEQLNTLAVRLSECL